MSDLPEEELVECSTRDVMNQIADISRMEESLDALRAIPSNMSLNFVAISMLISELQLIRHEIKKNGDWYRS